MGTVTKPNTFVNGTTANAIEVNSNFDTLYTLVNGNIDNDNMKGAAGIVFSKLDSATVAGVDETQTLTNKTLTTPVITSIYQDAAKTKLMTLPDTASDTLAALDATQSLANKTLPSPVLSGTVTGTYTLGGTPTATSPTITGSPTAAGSTWADLGSVTTADINGGTIDGTPIGGTTPAAVTGTTGTFSGAVTGTTGTFSGAVTAGAVSNVPLLVPGQVQNLSWTKAAGVITIAGADGTDLSATNPAWVCVPSAVTPGTFVTLPITANITFTDYDIDTGAGASDLFGWTFGVTTGVAWNNVLPVFIYALNKDDTAAGLRFGFSRNPRARDFGTNDIGDSDHTPAVAGQGNVFVAGAHFTLADYDSKPAQLVGATQIIKVAAADDWAMLGSSNIGGFGQHCIDYTTSRSYAFPPGQNGAVAGNYLSNAGGGTDPTFTTYTLTYTLGLDGVCIYNFLLDGDLGTDGSNTATGERLHLPYSSTQTGRFGQATVYTSGAGAIDALPTMVLTATAPYILFSVAYGTVVNVSAFQHGLRHIDGQLIFKAF